MAPQTLLLAPLSPLFSELSTHSQPLPSSGILRVTLSPSSGEYSLCIDKQKWGFGSEAVLGEFGIEEGGRQVACLTRDGTVHLFSMQSWSPSTPGSQSTPGAHSMQESNLPPLAHVQFRELSALCISTDRSAFHLSIIPPPSSSSSTPFDISITQLKQSSGLFGPLFHSNEQAMSAAFLHSPIPHAAVLGSDSKIRVWNLHSRSCVLSASVPVNDGILKSSPDSSGRAVIISPSGGVVYLQISFNASGQLLNLSVVAHSPLRLPNVVDVSFDPHSSSEAFNILLASGDVAHLQHPHASLEPFVTASLPPFPTSGMDWDDLLARYHFALGQPVSQVFRDVLSVVSPQMLAIAAARYRAIQGVTASASGEAFDVIRDQEDRIEWLRLASIIKELYIEAIRPICLDGNRVWYADYYGELLRVEPQLDTPALDEKSELALRDLALNSRGREGYSLVDLGKDILNKFDPPSHNSQLHLLKRGLKIPDSASKRIIPAIWKAQAQQRWVAAGSTLISLLQQDSCPDHEISEAFAHLSRVGLLRWIASQPSPTHSRDLESALLKMGMQIQCKANSLESRPASSLLDILLEEDPHCLDTLLDVTVKPSTSLSDVRLAAICLRLGSPETVLGMFDLLPLESSLSYIAGRSAISIGEHTDPVSYLRLGTMSKGESLQLLGEGNPPGSYAEYYAHCCSLLTAANMSGVDEFAKLAITAHRDLGGLTVENERKVWLLLFRSLIKNMDWKGAYLTVIQIPFADLQQDTLAQLVDSLVQHDISKLVAFSFPGLQSDVERTLEFRARNSDPLHQEGIRYYQVLAGYWIRKGDWRNAATSMYQHAKRISETASSEANFEHRASTILQSLLVSINCLSLLDKRDAWMRMALQPGQKSKTVRCVPESEFTFGNRAVDVVELSQVKREHCLIKARRTLAFHFPDLSSSLTPMIASDAVSLFTKINDFDAAIQIGRVTGADLSIVFSNLAERCISIERQGSNVDSSTAQFMKSSRTSYRLDGKLSERAWTILRNYLSAQSQQESKRLYEAVLKAVIENEFPIPNWLVKYFRENNPESLIQQCLESGYAEQAAEHSLTLVKSTTRPLLLEMKQSYLNYLLIDRVLEACHACSSERIDKLETQLESEAGMVFGSLAAECAEAAKSLSIFIQSGEIPPVLLERACGIAIFTVFRAGFIHSVRGGSGVVICRLPNGYFSAPSAVLVGGAGIGFMAGADKTRVVVIFRTKESARSLHSSSVTLGGNASLSAGSIGTATEGWSGISLQGQYVEPMLVFSSTKGLFSGVSVEGTVLAERSDANSSAYGSSLSASSILSGAIPVPSFAYPLVNLLPITPPTNYPVTVNTNSYQPSPQWMPSGNVNSYPSSAHLPPPPQHVLKDLSVNANQRVRPVSKARTSSVSSARHPARPSFPSKVLSADSLSTRPTSERGGTSQSSQASIRSNSSLRWRTSGGPPAARPASWAGRTSGQKPIDFSESPTAKELYSSGSSLSATRNIPHAVLEALRGANGTPMLYEDHESQNGSVYHLRDPVNRLPSPSTPSAISASSVAGMPSFGGVQVSSLYGLENRAATPWANPTDSAANSNNRLATYATPRVIVTLPSESAESSSEAGHQYERINAATEPDVTLPYRASSIASSHDLPSSVSRTEASPLPAASQQIPIPSPSRFTQRISDGLVESQRQSAESAERHRQSQPWSSAVETESLLSLTAMRNALSPAVSGVSTFDSNATPPPAYSSGGAPSVTSLDTNDRGNIIRRS